MRLGLLPVIGKVKGKIIVHEVGVRGRLGGNIIGIHADQLLLRRCRCGGHRHGGRVGKRPGSMRVTWPMPLHIRELHAKLEEVGEFIIARVGHIRPSQRVLLLHHEKCCLSDSNSGLRTEDGRQDAGDDRSEVEFLGAGEVKANRAGEREGKVKSKPGRLGTNDFRERGAR